MEEELNELPRPLERNDSDDTDDADDSESDEELDEWWIDH